MVFYVLLVGRSTDELAAAVNESLKLGWTLVGGATAALHGATPIYVQAMLRPNAVDEDPQ